MEEDLLAKVRKLYVAALERADTLIASISTADVNAVITTADEHADMTALTLAMNEVFSGVVDDTQRAMLAESLVTAIYVIGWKRGNVPTPFRDA